MVDRATAEILSALPAELSLGEDSAALPVAIRLVRVTEFGQ